MVHDLKLNVEPGASYLLKKISRILKEQGIESYLVGGFVRDMLLGRKTADIDIAVAADALEIARKVAAAIGGKYVLLDAGNQIGRVVAFEDKLEIDFSTLRSSIEEDLGQRDFTIDAMAMDLGKASFEKEHLVFPEVIDPFSGQVDLGRKVVRAVSESAFAADPIRLLRAVRLAAELGFRIDGETESLLRRDASLITGVAGERVREELLRLFALPGAGKFLAYLNELSLLTAIIPELAEGKGVAQPVVHVWDVLEHSVRSVSAVDFLLRQGEWEYADSKVLAVVPWSQRLEEHFKEEVSHASTRASLLRLAALLHDVAKPETKTIDETGRARFLGHAKEGAETVVNIMQRLRFTGKEIRLVEIMVLHHLRPTQMSQAELPTRRALYRFFRDTEDAGIDILFLNLADHLATRGPDLDRAGWQEHARMVEYVLEKRFEEESAVIPPKLVDGNDLITIFGLQPGPRIGEILEAVREAQAAGEITTREEALACIRTLMASQNS